MFEEEDERFHLDVRRTKDGSLIVASSHSKLSSEIRVMPADQPDVGFSVVEVRRPDVEYDIDHHRGVSADAHQRGRSQLPVARNEVGGHGGSSR